MPWPVDRAKLRQGGMDLKLEERKAESGECHGSATKDAMKLYMVSHSLVAIHRVIEVG